jgi:hypothetical protein
VDLATDLATDLETDLATESAIPVRERRAARGRGAPAVAEQRCGVCGSRDVEIDSVDLADTALRLGACNHCDHRWTRASSGAAALPMRRVESAQGSARRVAAAA